MEIPNWVKWLAVVGLIIWLISDPKGLGEFAGDLASGIGTAFRAAF